VVYNRLNKLLILNIYMPKTFLGYERLRKHLKAIRIVNILEDILILIVLLSILLIGSMSDFIFIVD
jgi:hypothetical protein